MQGHVLESSKGKSFAVTIDVLVGIRFGGRTFVRIGEEPSPAFHLDQYKPPSAL